MAQWILMTLYLCLAILAVRYASCCLKVRCAGSPAEPIAAAADFRAATDVALCSKMTLTEKTDHDNKCTGSAMLDVRTESEQCKPMNAHERRFSKLKILGIRHGVLLTCTGGCLFPKICIVDRCPVLMNCLIG